MKAQKKAYYQEHKEQIKEQKKAFYQANKEQKKVYQNSYYQAHKEAYKTYMKAYYQSHREEVKEYMKAYMKAYYKSDVNALGQTKKYIRQKSWYILKQMNLNIPNYEIHHCFGYEDPSKFIYISKSLHLKIHQFLRDNKISADTDHWMQIRDIVNDTDEFMYIKC